MSSSTKKIIFLTLFLCFLALSLLVADSFALLTRPRNVFYLVLSPFQKSLSLASLQTKNVVSFFLQIKQIAQENYQLRAENLNLISRLVTQEAQIKENETLRQALNFQKTSAQQLVLAKIVGRSIFLPYQVLIIDKGTQHGILKGMPVVVPPDIFVGQIIETASNFSFFLPLSNSQSQIQALIQSSQAGGILKGQESGLLLMEMIPQEKEINVGDLVTTIAHLSDVLNLEQEENYFWSGLLPLGRIKEIRRTDWGVSQTAIVKPLVDLTSVDLVAVITSASF